MKTTENGKNQMRSDSDQNRPNTNRRTRGWKWTDCIPAVLISFTFFLFGPLNIYLTNVREFWFTLPDFWWACAIFAVVFSAILSLIGFLLPQKARGIYSTILLGISLGLCVQGNYVNTDYGVLDGSEIDWSSYKTTAVLNTLLWAVCISLPFVLRKICSKRYDSIKKYGSTALFAVQLLVVMLMFFSVHSLDIVVSNTNSDIGLNAVSDDRNVIVFVLDTFDQVYFEQLLENEPEFLEPLDGFTYFNNNVGHYPTTKGALPYILTGQEYRNEQPYSDYVETAYEETDFYSDLYENGWEIGLYTMDRFTNSDSCRIYAENVINHRPTVSSYPSFLSKYYKLTAFKYFPHILKPSFFVYSEEFDDFEELAGDHAGELFSADNLKYYENLLKNGLSIQKEPSYRFIHLDGTHQPYDIDENINKVENGESDSYRQSKAVLKIVYEYLSQLQKLGVYDNSTILLIADHGRGSEDISNPIFMVKRQNDHGELSFSNAPVCQADIMATIMEDIGLNADEKYGKSAFDYTEYEDRYRNFLYYSWDDSWLSTTLPDMTEYYVDAEDNLVSNFHKVGGENHPYELGTTLSCTGDDLIKTYAVYGLSGNEDDWVWSLGTTTEFWFDLTNYEGGDLSVSIEFMYIFDEQEIAVNVGDVTVFRQEMNEPRTVNFTIPEELVSSQLVLDFLYPDACSPASKNISSDDRVLSAAFRSIKIEKAENDCRDEDGEYRQYKLGTKLRCTGDPTIEDYSVYGLAEVEEDWIWSLGTSTKFRFDLKKYEGGDLNATIEFKHVMPDQTVEVKVGGVDLFKQNVNEAGTFSFTIPEELVTDHLDIELVYPNACSPASTNISSDDRVLSVAFETLNIRYSG